MESPVTTAIFALKPFSRNARGDRLARAVRIEPAGIHHELHAARGGERPQLDQHRHAVARVTGARVFLAVFLQDRERQFGEVIAAMYWTLPLSIEARTGRQESP